MRPPHGKPIDTEKAERILLALRQGKTLAVICGGRVNGKRVSSEIITTYIRFREYCDANSNYAQIAKPLLEANYKASNFRKGKARRCDKTCSRGHVLEGSNVGWKMQGYGTTERSRYCRACEIERENRGPKMKPGELRRVKEAIMSGLTVSQITHRSPQHKMIVTFRKLKRYRIENPEFDRFMIENARAPLSRSRLLKCQIVPANIGFNFSAPNFEKPIRKDVPPFLFQDGDLEWVSSLIPRGLPSFVRDEIVQNAFAELCERAVSRDEVPATVKRLVKDQAKLFPTMFRKFGDSPLVSLDELVFEDGSTTRGDMVTHGLWD